MTAPKKMVRSFINFVFLTRMFKNYSLVFFYVVVLLLSISGNCSVNHGFLIDQKDSLKFKLLDSCKIYSKQKKYAKAYKVAQELNDFALEIKDTALLLNSYYRMGYYAYNAKNPIKAIQHYTAGIDLKTSPKYNTYKINLFYNKISDLNTIGDFKEAQKTAIDGLTIARQVKDTTAMVDFYNKLAISLAKNFEFNESETAYLKALQLETNNQNKARILNNIGVLYKHQNKYHQAVKIYDSIQTKIKYDSPLLEASIKSNLGYALTQINNKKRAILLLNQALTTRTELEDNNGLFASYIHLFNYYKNDNYTKAALYANEALAIATQKTKSPDSEKEALSHLVSLQVASKMETNRFFFLTDSIARSKQKTINDYTAAKFQTKEKELEIAKQKEDIALAESNIAKKETQQGYYITGIIVMVTLLVSLFVYALQRKKIISRNHKIATLEAAELERNKLSGNVHDSVADKIREAMLYADNFETQHPNLGFKKLGDIIESGYNKLRNVSQEYMYLDFRKIEFNSQIQSLLNDKEQLYKIEIDSEGLGNIQWQLVSRTIKIELYRSLQELLINISKHSQATHVIVTFNSNKKTVKMKVKDNGIGCDPSSLKANTGLTDMERRIKLLNGIIKIETTINTGYETFIGIPLN